jgi:hypothetical protein
MKRALTLACILLGLLIPQAVYAAPISVLPAGVYISSDSTGRSAIIPLSGSDTSCTLTVYNTGGATLTVQGFANGPAIWVKNAAFGTSGIISAPGQYAGSITSFPSAFSFVYSHNGGSLAYSITGCGIVSGSGEGGSVTISAPLDSQGHVAIGCFTGNSASVCSGGGGTGLPFTGGSSGNAFAANQGLSLFASNGTAQDAIKETSGALWGLLQSGSVVNQTTGTAGYGYILDSAGTNVAGVDSFHNVLVSPKTAGLVSGTGNTYSVTYPDVSTTSAAITTATTTLVVSGVASQNTFVFFAGAETTGTNTADNVTFIAGTGATCGVGTITPFAPLPTGLGAANTWSYSYSGSQSVGAATNSGAVPASVPFVLPTAFNLCAVTSGTTVNIKILALSATHV